MILYRFLLICFLCLGLSNAVNAVTFRAEASPLLAPDTIEVGQSFTIDIYANNKITVAK